LEAGSVIRAAGGVPWRVQGHRRIEFLLVHRPQYDDWTFPKGKAKRDETDEAAALREVLEETGLKCELGRELATTHYIDRCGRPKYVRYWAMGPVTRPATPGHDVDDIAWLTQERVAQRLSYQRDIAVLEALTGPL
jgi:8-oxo-dGTP diphosphatase